MNGFTQTFDPDHDYGYAVHREAVNHLNACAEAFDLLEDNCTGEITDPASAPYCGCVTCDVREVLHVAWPLIEEVIRQKVAWENAQQ